MNGFEIAGINAIYCEGLQAKREARFTRALARMVNKITIRGTSNLGLTTKVAGGDVIAAVAK